MFLLCLFTGCSQAWHHYPPFKVKFLAFVLVLPLPTFSAKNLAQSWWPQKISRLILRLEAFSRSMRWSIRKKQHRMRVEVSPRKNQVQTHCFYFTTVYYNCSNDSELNRIYYGGHRICHKQESNISPSQPIIFRSPKYACMLATSRFCSFNRQFLSGIFFFEP